MRWAAARGIFQWLRRAMDEPAKPKTDDAAPADPSKEAMDAMREHLRRVGTALGVAGGALLSGLGYTQVHKIFPLPDGAHGWGLALAIASSTAALVGAALLAGRFYAAQRRIPVSTADDERARFHWRTPSGLTRAERRIRDRIRGNSARDEIARSLNAVELRALRYERMSRRRPAERDELATEATRLRDAVHTTLGQAAAAVLEHRARKAFSGWLTMIALLLTIAGIIGVFGLADWSQGQRDLVTLGKHCSEAKAPIAACKRFGAAAAGGATAQASTEGNPWLNSYTETVLQTPTTEYRVYGGDSGRIGTWVTPTKPADATKARALLALPDENSVQCTVRVDIPAGAKIRLGHAGPLFHHPGGGAQAKILSALDKVGFSVDRPLPPSHGPCP
jgi:hypothetical protein